MLSWTYTSIVNYPRSESRATSTYNSTYSSFASGSVYNTLNQGDNIADTSSANSLTNISLSNINASTFIKRGFTNNIGETENSRSFISYTNETRTASNSLTDSVFSVSSSNSFSLSFKSSVSGTTHVISAVTSISQQLFNLYSRVTSVLSTFSTYGESGSTNQYHQETDGTSDGTTFTTGATNQTPSSASSTEILSQQISTSATFTHATTTNISVEIEFTTISTFTSTIFDYYTSLVSNQNTIYTSSFSSNFSPVISFTYTGIGQTTSSISRKALTDFTDTVLINTDGNMVVITIYEAENNGDDIFLNGTGGYSRDWMIVPPQTNNFSIGLVPIINLSTYTRYTSYDTYWSTYLISQNSDSSGYSGTTFGTSILESTRISNSNSSITRYINQNIFTTSNSTQAIVLASSYTTTGLYGITDYNNTSTTNSFTARSALIYSTTRYFSSLVLTTYNVIVNNGSGTLLDSINGSFVSILSKNSTISIGGTFPTSSSNVTQSSDSGSGLSTATLTDFTGQTENSFIWSSSSSFSSTRFIQYDLNQKAVYLTSVASEIFNYIGQQRTLYQPPSAFGPNEGLYERFSLNGNFGTSVKSLLFKNAMSQYDGPIGASLAQALILSNQSRTFTDTNGSFTSYLNNNDKKIYVSTISEGQSTHDTFSAEIIGVGDTSQFIMSTVNLGNNPTSFGGIVNDSRMNKFTILNYPLAIANYTTINGASSGSFSSAFLSFQEVESSSVFYNKINLPALSYVGNQDGLSAPIGASTFRSTMSTYIPF